MTVEELLNQARDALTVKRVFGDPFEKDGLTILPVAAVRGGGGGGMGKGSEGGGGGFGLVARPVGVFVIKKGALRWQPAVDVNRVILGAQILFGLVIVAGIARARARARRQMMRQLAQERRGPPQQPLPGMGGSPASS